MRGKSLWLLRNERTIVFLFSPWTAVGHQHWLFFLWAVMPKVSRLGRCSTTLLLSPPQRREHPSHVHGEESSAQGTHRTKIVRSFTTQTKTSISHSKTLTLVIQKFSNKYGCTGMTSAHAVLCFHSKLDLQLMTYNYYPPGLH